MTFKNEIKFWLIFAKQRNLLSITVLLKSEEKGIDPP